MTDINRRWLLARRPEGQVKDADFEWTETAVPTPQPGEAVVRTLYLSFDPAQRGWLNDVPSYIPPVQIGEPMRAGGIGQVVASERDDLAVGDLVQGTLSWQDYVVISDGGMEAPRKISADVPLTWHLGVLGLTGITAYFGMLDVAGVKEGDVVLVSGAAGATGSVAGQLAKIHGAKQVIGIAGGSQKCAWLTEKAGYDAAIDYKAENIDERLKQIAPKGIDVFFDNVGGVALDAALLNIKQGATVALCGGISSGYSMDLPPGPKYYMQLVIKSARMEGFVVLKFADRFGEAIQALAGWVSEGKIAFEEDVKHGLENCPEVLRGLFKGRNFGKQLLKVADAPIS